MRVSKTSVKVERVGGGNIPQDQLVGVRAEKYNILFGVMNP